METLRRVIASVAIVAILATAFPRDAAAVTFTISGTVTASGGGPLQGVLVYAYQGGAGSTCCTPVSGVTTDASGVYQILVSPGTYRLRFYPNSTTYVERWYSNAPDFASAGDVIVAGNVMGIDAALVAGRKIQGHVTNSAASGVAGIGVHAFDATKPCCAWVTGTTSDATGQYTLVVPSGSYSVLFYPGGGTYVAQWYLNSSSFAAGATIVVSGADVAGIDAQLADAYTITGTVTAAAGGPIADVFVGAFQAGGICCEWVTGVQTDALGGYVLPVTNGSYKLQFFPTHGDALGEWWSAAPTFDAATAITVSNASVTGKNATLAAGHRISGTVTALTGGAPIGNVYIGVMRAAGFFDWVAGTGTDSQGKYSVAVPDGSYRVQFYPGQGTFLEQYWNAAPDFQSATTVTMAGADVPGIDAHLVTGLTVSGSVTAATNGLPIDQVFVGAYDAHLPCCTWVGGSGTDALGDYTIAVAPGDYKLMFWPNTGTFLQQWSGGAADFDSAATVSVGANVSGQDAHLLTGHTIGGTVIAASSGTPLERVWVSVIKATGEWVGGSMTSSTGRYAIPVADGQYRLRFDPPTGYVSEWWDDQLDMSLAQTVTVSGVNLTGQDAQLATGRLITGKITDTAGPVAGTNVQAYLASAGCAAQSVAMGFSDSSGHYAVTVAAGTYKLAFFDSDHLFEWYNDKADCAAASSIVVGGSDVSGQDAVLATGHLISGIVTGPSGPIAGAWVSAYQGTCASLTWTAGASSDTSGHYSIRVASGTYLVNTFASGYQNEWYDDQLDCFAATAMTVGTSDVTGTDVLLTPTHEVTGLVTDGGGGVSGAQVAAQTSSSSCSSPVWVGGATADGSGNYTLELPDGSYKLWFSDPNHVPQYFNGKADCASADAVVVSGANLSGKNAVLTRAYAVAGTVTAAAGGAPIAGAAVSAWSGSTLVGSTATDGSGHYAIPLPNGTYTLAFSAAGMALQWWNGKSSQLSADSITVFNAGVPGMDAAVAP